MATELVRILPVGDSITQGGKLDRPEYTYRFPLQKMLREKGISFDIVGSRTHGLQDGSEWPEVLPGVPFVPNHEGYYGWKTRDVVDAVMEHWEAIGATPDIVLIHLGTNDQENLPHAETVQQPLREFIVFLRSKNPRVAVLLGHLNFNDSAGAYSIRPLVDELALDMSNEESPVRAVEHFKGWQENPEKEDTDTYDWSHPNPRGQQKMAEKWLDSMLPVIAANAASRPN